MHITQCLVGGVNILRENFLHSTATNDHCASLTLHTSSLSTVRLSVHVRRVNALHLSYIQQFSNRLRRKQLQAHDSMNTYPRVSVLSANSNAVLEKVWQI